MKDLQCLHSIASFKNLNAGALQDCLNVRPNSAVIIHNQDEAAADVVL